MAWLGLYVAYLLAVLHVKTMKKSGLTVPTISGAFNDALDEYL